MKVVLSLALPCFTFEFGKTNVVHLSESWLDSAHK